MTPQETLRRHLRESIAALVNEEGKRTLGPCEIKAYCRGVVRGRASSCNIMGLLTPEEAVFIDAFISASCKRLPLPPVPVTLTSETLPSEITQ